MNVMCFGWEAKLFAILLMVHEELDSNNQCSPSNRMQNMEEKNEIKMGEKWKQPDISIYW